MVLTAAPKEAVRLVGISTQATGKTAAVLIEATEPVAYAVSRPDPLTVFVDLRDVTLGDASHTGAKQGPVSGVTVEKAVGVDGGQVARVRVALSSPSAYRVRSARNVIRLELEPEAQGRIDDARAACRRDRSTAPRPRARRSRPRRSRRFAPAIRARPRPSPSRATAA